MIKISVGNLSSFLVRFFKKINAPFRVTIVNEDTLQEEFVAHLTKKSVYIFLSSVLIGIFLLFSILLFFTPLRYYIPGNNNSISRQEIIKLQKLSDSLLKLNATRETYILNLLNVANGNINNEKDTSLLSESAINQAKMANNNKVDRAKNYEYLKNVKPDTTNVKKVGKKDSL